MWLTNLGAWAQPAPTSRLANGVNLSSTPRRVSPLPPHRRTERAALCSWDANGTICQARTWPPKSDFLYRARDSATESVPGKVPLIHETHKTARKPHLGSPEQTRISLTPAGGTGEKNRDARRPRGGAQRGQSPLVTRCRPSSVPRGSQKSRRTEAALQRRDKKSWHRSSRGGPGLVLEKLGVCGGDTLLRAQGVLCADPPDGAT